jgi:hypothetical protein
MFWKFGDYVTPASGNETQTWLVKHPDARAALRDMLMLLTTRRDWHSLNGKQVRFMEEEHAGLVTIRLTLQGSLSRPKHKYRPVGFIRMAGSFQEFVFLTACEKFEHGRLVPRGTFDHALDLKKSCERLEGKVDEHCH